MQFLLTESERAELVDRHELTLANHALVVTRTMILSLSGFECIHTPGGRNEGGYCGDCPCSPLGKGDEYRTWERICSLPKRYGK
jgi:hypothetical protein